MRILVTNDDGITAEGIERLARMARELGEVTVVAPDSQCSAMSQKLSILTDIRARRAEFPVEGVTAYTVSGTPADCVRMAVDMLLPERPDIVFSGINNGYNTGYDIAYSGTVGACMEALIAGIPAIAFSTDFRGVFGATDAYLGDVTRQVLERPIAHNEIWNLNFPGVEADECRGILWDRVIAQDDFYNNKYEFAGQEPDGTMCYHIVPDRISEALPGTDIAAVTDGYVSIGKIRCSVISDDPAERVTYRGRRIKKA